MDRRKLGKYDVLGRLSSGGMSEIFLAHHTGVGGFKKLVVLKSILPDIGGEEDFVRMFLEEARTTAAFNHPNVAQVYELDVADGVLFMAMEFVQGCTLVELARACRLAKEPIPLGLTLAAVRDTALALHYAHTFTDARGRKRIVIHRDVAEKNIMVTYDGVTKLLDFGIAKALGRVATGRTSVGMVKGTSGYMSPEQIRGDPLDPRSDIFSLGVVLHECLTGMRLFFGKNAEEGMLAALREQVQPPSRQNRAVTPEVDSVVLKALARNREDRFATALEMARAVERASAGTIWHPEQCAEVVTRLFADRRQETRKLLESSGVASDTTGEITVGSVLAKVKASTDDGASTHSHLPSSPRPVHRLPPPQSGPPTNPARGRNISQQPTPQLPSPRPSDPLRASAPRPVNNSTEDEAKTVPAAAVPEEIRALRKRLTSPEASPRPSASAGRPAAPSAPTKPSTPADSHPNPSGPVAEAAVTRSVSSTPQPDPGPHRRTKPESGPRSQQVSALTSQEGQGAASEDEAKTTIGRPYDESKREVTELVKHLEGPPSTTPEQPRRLIGRPVLVVLIFVLTLALAGASAAYFLGFLQK